MPQNGSLKPAVFLDRDGVINRTSVLNGRSYAPRLPEELEILPGVKEAVQLFFSAGLEVVVVTNQPDLGNGLMTRDNLNKIHLNIGFQTGLKHFYVCEHSEREFCECRKPKTGLLLRAAKELNLNLNESFLIGDRWKDIQAGQEAGCRCFFIDYKYAEQQPNQPFCRVSSVLEAVTLILEIKHD